MKAVWDRHIPRKSASEQRRLVEMAHDCGFGTVIVSLDTVDSPGTGLKARMLDCAKEHGMTVLDIVSPSVSDDGNETTLDAINEQSGVYEHRRLSHHWVPPVLGCDLLCFNHRRSREVLENRVATALDRTEGVAFDGFGFRSRYACFCSATGVGSIGSDEVTGVTNQRLQRCEQHPKPPSSGSRNDSMNMQKPSMTRHS